MFPVSKYISALKPQKYSSKASKATTTAILTTSATTAGLGKFSRSLHPGISLDSPLDLWASDCRDPPETYVFILLWEICDACPIVSMHLLSNSKKFREEEKGGLGGGFAGRDSVPIGFGRTMSGRRP